jgi:hypothetical protein
VKNASKTKKEVSSNLRATTSINITTNIITDKIQIQIQLLLMLAKEITKLRRTKQRKSQLFQSAMDQMELKELIAWHLNQQRRRDHLLNCHAQEVCHLLNAKLFLNRMIMLLLQEMKEMVLLRRMTPKKFKNFQLAFLMDQMDQRE